MLHIGVEDARAWHVHVAAVLASNQWPTARVQPPKLQPYGALVTTPPASCCTSANGIPEDS